MRPITTPLIVLGAFALTGISFAAEQTSPDVGSWHGWHGHMPGFWWIFPMMMMFMFMFFIFLFVFSGDRGHWRRRWRRWMHEHPESQHRYDGDQGAIPESALDILNKRYARGEIDKEEYEDKKATIISTTT